MFGYFHLKMMKESVRYFIRLALEQQTGLFRKEQP